MAVDNAGVGAGRRLRTWLACALVVGSVSGFFATAVTSSPASASTPLVNETARLIGSDSSGNFGRAVSAAGDTVVVGDPSHSAVYIYTRPSTGWSGSLQETAKLTSSTVNFGAAVAISADGSTLVVGSPGTSSAIYSDLFVYDKPAAGWTTGQSPDRDYEDFDAASALGHNSLLGEQVVVSPDGSWVGGLEFYDPHLDGSSFPFPGAVAMWDTSTPTLSESPDALLWVGDSGVPSDISSLATNESGTAVFAGLNSGGGAIGAVWDTPASGVWSGTGYNTPAATLSEPAAVFYAATSVAASGDQVVLGTAGLSDGGVNNSGGAYVFDEPPGGWTGAVTRSAALTPSDPSGAEVGATVGFSGDEIALGAPLATVGANADQGEVYTYKEPAGGWTDATETYRMAATNGAARDRLGAFNSDVPGFDLGGTLAMTGNYLAVGAPEPAADKPVYLLVDKDTLDVQKAGTGSGTVSGAGIDCGVTCAADQVPGAVATLHASAAAGSNFVGWSGGGCSGTGTCTVTMSGDLAVTATFASDGAGVHSLSVATAGSGSGLVASGSSGISCPGTCSALFPVGTVETLTAVPADSSSAFVGWSGAGCAGTGDCTVTMSEDVGVTATFARLPVLTVSTAGSGAGTVSSSPGGISCPGACSAGFASEAPVTLTATPAAGSVFTGWSGACSGGGTTCGLIMGSDQSVTATFAPSELLQVTIGGTASGSVSSSPAGITCPGACSNAFVEGTSVTLTPAPGPGNIFDGWSGAGCSGTGTCTVDLSAAAAVTATFSPPEPVLTVSLAGSGTGSVTSAPAGISCPTNCSEGVPYGFLIALSASSGPHSTFDGWSGQGCSGTGLCYVDATAATSMTATFTSWPRLTLSVTGTSDTSNPNDLGGGLLSSTPSGVSCTAPTSGTCSAYFPPGQAVTLQATPSGTSQINGWSGACPSNSGSTCTVTMTSDQQVGVQFGGLGFQAVQVQMWGTGSGFVTMDAVPPTLSPDYCEYSGGSTEVNPATCEFDFPGNQGLGTMTVVFTPSSGSTFQFVTGPCSTGNTCTVGNGQPDSGYGIGVTFGGTPSPTEALNVSTAGSGGGSVAGSHGAGIQCPSYCSESYFSGTNVTLTETPAAGSTFAGWSGGGCSGVATTCSVTMSAAQSVTATFDLNQPPPATFTVSVAGSGAGTVSGSDGASAIACPGACSETYQPPATMTLTETPAVNSVFTGWSGGGCSGTATTCSVAGDTGDQSVTATFAILPVLTVAPAGTGSGGVTAAGGFNCPSTCTSYVPAGDGQVTLTETPDAGSYFGGWSGGGCSGTATTCITTVTADETVTATFDLLPVLTVSLVGTGSGTVTGTNLSCPGQCSAPYQPDPQVSVTETPAAGSVFVGWSDPTCGTAATCSVALPPSTVLTAEFKALPVLSVTVAGNGPGSVSSTDAAIDCPGTCVSSYAPDAPVTLSETPGRGSSFVAWSGGGCSGSAATCVVTMSTAQDVTATFASPATPGVVDLVFTTQPDGGTGGVPWSRQPVVTAENSLGATLVSYSGSVTLSASGGSGTLSGCTATTTVGVAAFSGCRIDTTGTYALTASSGSATPSVSNNLDISAGPPTAVMFTAQPPTDVGSGGSFTVSVSGTDAGGNPAIGNVTLALASGPAGAHLACGSNPAALSSGTVSWTCTIDTTGTYTLSATDGTASATSGSVTITPRNVLSVTLAGTGTGTVTSNPTGISCPGACSFGFVPGSVVTLTAAGTSGSRFAGWSGGGCAGTGACAVTMSAVRSVTATFRSSSAGGGSGTPGDVGYRMVGSDGGIFAFGDAPFYGSMGGTHLNAPVVGMATTGDNKGYWLDASDGGIFAFGDAPYYGSEGGTHLNAPVVGMAPVADGTGYWLVASDGGVFAFGHASFYGSEGGAHLKASIVGLTATPDDKGYWLVASDGGVFAFGDASFYGSVGGAHLNAPVVGMAPTDDGKGYWLDASDGGIFAFGDASFLGSMGGTHLNGPMVAMLATATGKGYWLVASDGGIFAFGDASFLGSMGGTHLNAPVVGISS